ncbi:DUF6056 family protein [Anaerovibrio sp.]|uniref:DUF3329 domain-containing protein n=1 Tax=Anaerovibrio sp. TaxID=1872532 RepID=UPI00388F44CF
MLRGIAKVWEKIPWQVILLFFGAIFLWRNHLMPMVGDDLAYAFIWDPERGGNLMDGIGLRQKIESLGDIISSQWTHYFTWGGRTLSMLIIQFFAWKHGAGFDTANTIVYLLLMMVLYWLAVGKIESPTKAKGCFLWAILGINFGIFDYITTMVWMTGACVYLWTGLWECAFLLPYAMAYRNEDFGRQWPKWSVLAMAILGLFAGWSEEGGSLVTLSLLGLLLMAYYRREGQLKPWMVAGTVGAVMGCLLLMLAPGSIMREEFMLQYEPEYVLPADKLFSVDMFYRNFTDGFLPIFLLESFLFLPLIIYFIKGKKTRDVKHYIMAFTGAGMEVLCLMMFAPEFKLHTGFHSTLFLTIASTAALRECIPFLKEKCQLSSWWRRSFLALGMASFAYVIFSLAGALYVETSVAQQLQSRMEYVEQHRNDDEIVVSALYIPYDLDEWMGLWAVSTYHLIYGMDLEYKPQDNRSNMFAQYYGLKCIHIDKEFDWERVGEE